MYYFDSDARLRIKKLRQFLSFTFYVYIVVICLQLNSITPNILRPQKFIFERIKSILNKRKKHLFDYLQYTINKELKRNTILFFFVYFNKENVYTIIG